MTDIFGPEKVVADKFNTLMLRIAALQAELAITKAELNAKLDILRADLNGLWLRLYGIERRLGRLEFAMYVSLFVSAANLALLLRLNYP